MFQIMMMRAAAAARPRMACLQTKSFGSMVEMGPKALATGRFAGKSAIVTGGGKGFGEAISKVLSAEGARVLIADIDVAAGKKVAAEIPGGWFAEMDTSEADKVQALFAEAASAFDGRIDIVINNAGIVGTTVPTHERPLELWHKCVDVNLNGVFYVLQAALKQMVSQEPNGGVIVNLASIAGLEAIPWLPIEYTTTKHGVVGMTKHAAVEYAGHGIRVCAISPTFVATPLVIEFAKSMTPEMLEAAANFNPIPGAPDPEDVAQAALFLCSDSARWVSGSVLKVDGAYCAGSSTPSVR